MKIIITRIGKIFLLLVVLFTVACTKPNLNGHWHITSIKEDKIMGSDYLTLDVYDDTLGIINDQVFLNRGLAGPIDLKKWEMLFGGECFVLNFKFTMQKEALFLRQIEYTQPGEKQFIAKRCAKNCCNQQQDYFSSTMLEMDLPQKKDSIGLWKAGNSPTSLIYPLFFGLAKNTNDQSIRFTTGLKDFEVSIDSIAVYEKKFLVKIPEQQWKRVKRVIYADKNTPLKNIIPVLKKYQALGVHKMVVALKAMDNNQKLTIWYQLINPLTILEANNSSITWGDFLNNNKFE